MDRTQQYCRDHSTPASDIATNGSSSGRSSPLDFGDIIDDTAVKKDKSKMDHLHHQQQQKHRIPSTSHSPINLIDFNSDDNNDTDIDTLQFDRVEGRSSQHLNESELSSSSSKRCEMDLQEERDRFSPINVTSGDEDSNEYNHHQNNEPCTSNIEFLTRSSEEVLSPGLTSIGGNGGVSVSSDVDNKIFEKRKIKPTSTKEEKQRQNEEIVILETSSISSETGSWESVFPHRSNNEVKDCCRTFLQNERSYCLQCRKTISRSDTLERSDYISCTPPSNHPAGVGGTASSSSVGACFIDASTLLDDSEINYPTLGPQLPDGGCFAPKPPIQTCHNPQQQHHHNPITPAITPSTTSELLTLTANKLDKVTPDDDVSESSDKSGRQRKKHFDQLETFHKSFELCKFKQTPAASSRIAQASPKTRVESSSSSSSGVSPQRGNSSEENSNNLSDEEKILKRESTKQTSSRVDIKDQYVDDDSCCFGSGNVVGGNNGSQPPVAFNISSLDDKDNLPRQGTFDMDDKDLVRIRRDQERKQGNLVFQNSIQQFSGHLISPKIPYTEDTFSDFPINLCMITSDSEKSQATTTANNFDSMSNFGDTSYSGKSSLNYQSEQDVPPTSTCTPSSTPHNSIVQTSIDHLMCKDDASRDGVFSDSSSASTSAIKIPKRSTRCDDSAPILSGGASVKDFTPKQCESPPVRRKTDSCPIVSGGFASLDLNFDDSMTKSREKVIKDQPSSITSWVVDMSDCKLFQKRRSTSSSSSTDNTSHSLGASTTDHNDSGGSQKSGLGFYVSLNEPTSLKKTSDDHHEEPHRRMTKSLHVQIKKPTGFFVDLSESEQSDTATPPPSLNTHTPQINSNGDDKKNIFSMFIDFGEKKDLSRREPLSLASRLSSSLHKKKSDDLVAAKNNSSSTDTLMTRSSGGSSSHRYSKEKLNSEGDATKSSSDEINQPSSIEADTMPFRRMQSRALQKEESSKRHSWNNSETTSSHLQSDHIVEPKRSASLSHDSGIMSILNKIPLISKTSSLSIDSSLSPLEDFTGSKSELSAYSNKSNCTTSTSVHSSGAKDTDIVVIKMKKRRQDAQINETYDKSSQGSLTDGVLSKDLSPMSTTDTEDLTFQQDDAFPADITSTSPQQQQQQQQQHQHQQQLHKDINGRTVIMETIIETKETSSPKKQQTSFNTSSRNNCDKPLSSNDITSKSSTHTMETLHATIEKQKQLLETVTEHVEVTTTTSSNFVKLSDMDNPVAKFELHSPEAIMSKSTGSNRHMSRLFQDTRTRPQSWTMTRSTGNNIINITSSFENLRSLTRLFPHLTKELSNSLPSDVSFDNYRNTNDSEYIQSDVSGESSLMSSISRSGMDESTISCRQPRRLGEDLLKMFLQEIATDVVVEVNGRRIKAHKCILRSRCQYFAAMLAGGWVQSAGNVISLPGYSYSSVHFALCHIYSGASHPPDGISLVELAALADLLGLEGLKEVTAHTLKINYCHNFHKPCSGCIDGILQVLPVALNHALDDLYRKCLKWTCKYYLKVWPTRSFAYLPSDLFGRCKQQIVAHVTSETVLETILDCDHLISQLAPCRWAIAVENLVRDILDAAYRYISDHFASLIASDCFLSLGHDKSINIGRLETILLRTASSLTPDQACRSYQRITRLNAVLASKVINVPNVDATAMNGYSNGIHEEEMDWNQEFIRLVDAILSAIEQCLTRQCSRAMRVSAWQRMDLELRKKVQKLACLTEPTINLKRGNSLNNKTASKPFSFNPNSRNQDLYQVKLAIQAHSKRALAQDTQLYRANVDTQTHSLDREIKTIEKGVQANNDIKVNVGGKIEKVTLRPNVRSLQQTRPKSEGNTGKNLGHRRTQSEDSSYLSKPARTLFQKDAIKSRYLQPQKPRGPLKSQTSSNIPSIRGKHISSSDSSRTSSPATGGGAKRLSVNVNRKIGTKSINMSLDSLASPSKKKAEKLHHQGVIDMEISVDSLSGSMKSSIKTDKTISQESLSRCDLLNKKDNNKISRSNPIINKENNHQTITNTTTSSSTSSKLQPGGKLAARNKTQLLCQTTSNSSPLSNTNKSSRLSSTTSSVNSPRDAYKNRSISLPAGQAQNNQPVRKSFLSAKSREILARKSAAANANANNIKTVSTTTTTTQNQQSPGSTTKLNHIGSNKSSPIPINKSCSSSNIPTRKSASLNLNIRKSVKSIANTVANQTKSSQLKCVPKVTQQQLNKISNKSSKQNSKQNIGEHHIELIIEGPKEIETKLERSSTFCKEVPDLPLSELQVIE